MSHRLRYAARSDRGLVRANNQDSVYAGDRLLVVADGMGGHAAGDLASRVVVAAFTDLDSDTPGEDLTTPLHQAIRSGNEAIAELVEEDPELDGMGTTVTAMLFDGDRMALAHIGDSRAYLYRDGVLHQLSHDDTFVQSLVDEGRITEEEATHHPQRNLLLRALNGSDADPMLSLRHIHIGDRYMLCSDGLSSVVAAEAIADGLAEPDADTAADRLVELALVAGGPDNVTVIVADVMEVGARSSAPTGVYDPDITGPIKPLHETQRMPRVPLPPPREERATGPVVPFDPDADRDRDSADTRGDDFDVDDLVGDDQDGDDQQKQDDATDLERSERRRAVRFRTLLTLAIVVALAAAVTSLVVWARDQYYVGVSSSDGTVVVYRGLNGSLLGISFSSVAEPSCVIDPAAPAGTPCAPLYVDDLQQSAKDLVNGGSPSGDLTAARDIVEQLSHRMLPLCRTTTDTPTGGQSTQPSSSDQSGSGTTDSGSPRSTARSSDTSTSSTRRTPGRPSDGNRLRAAGTPLTTPDAASVPAGEALAEIARSLTALGELGQAAGLRAAATSSEQSSTVPSTTSTPLTTDPTTGGNPTPCRVRR